MGGEGMQQMEEAEQRKPHTVGMKFPIKPSSARSRVDVVAVSFLLVFRSFPRPRFRADEEARTQVEGAASGGEIAGYARASGADT
jgi:hypothetical protein